MIEKEKYIKIIDDLFATFETKAGQAGLAKVFFNVITLIENLYGIPKRTNFTKFAIRINAVENVAIF